MDIKELYTLRKILIEEGLTDDVKDIDQLIKETTSATGGSGGGSVMSGGTSLANSQGGAGTIQSSQPSKFPGALNGADWIDGGGKEGSGDDTISLAYNPSGANRIFQKVKMGKGHGAHTGKKSREKPLDLKHISNMLKNRGKDGIEKPGKVMDFDKFAKSQLDDVTKVEK
jgi:hypothetical protein